MTELQPRVGDMVDYVAYGTPGGEFPAGVCRAAVVTEITLACAPRAERLADLEMQAKAEQASGAPRVSLCVINPTGFYFTRDVRFDAGWLEPGGMGHSDVRTYEPGTWHFRGQV